MPGHCLRLLVPVKRLSDLEVALTYVAQLPGDPPVRVFLLHVTPAAPCGKLLDAQAQQSMAAEECGASALLAQAARHCDAHALQHSSYILSGDVAFSILDAAELLGCDGIVMARRTDWLRRIFSSETMRKVERLRRHVPLLLVDPGRMALKDAQA